MKKQGKRAVDNLFDFLEIIVMAMFVVVLVFTFVFRTVNVQGQSMQDTLFENDSLVISKLLYTPKQGDIVVVNSSVLDNRIIKRIIAVEGQKVEIDNKSAIVKVNGAVLDESYIKCDGSFDDEYFDERYYNKESEVYEYEVPVFSSSEKKLVGCEALMSACGMLLCNGRQPKSFHRQPCNRICAL